jgi:coenzyme F420 hydrogenase subunit beta
MTAEWTDISVGVVEDLEGWNTVVVRSDPGSQLMDGAVRDGWLEVGELPPENLEHLREASLSKRIRGKRNREEMGRMGEDECNQ